ncbi:hypothetical protein F5878DRAFT_667918 [Lentinula raphanica]|uniref:Uncharacterized protein n=1 Tax=Lentinula raphanica TaxID=153919 RepID=A0AA38U3T8_9AGAR|nr:hypothetical protein F5878DRAFT_667918 [Lentinula raphanica]
MTSYQELLAGLKNKKSSTTSILTYQELLSRPQNPRTTSSNQPTSPQPKLTWLHDSSKTSVLKYSNLLAGSSDPDASDYDMRVMAAAMTLNTFQNSQTQSSSLETSFEKFQTEITKETMSLFFHAPRLMMLSNSGSQVRSMLDHAGDAGSAEEHSLESLPIPGCTGRLQFSEPTKRNIKTTRALVTVSSLKQAALDLQVTIQNLSFSQSSADIQSALCAVEDGTDTLHQQN